MIRSLAVVLAASVALAADPPKPADSPPVAVMAAPSTGHVELTRVTPGKDGGLQLTQSVPVTKMVDVTVTKLVDGKQVPVMEKRTVTAMEQMAVTMSTKEFKATGADGKDIPAADLEKKLKGGAVVVVSWGALSADSRKVFKDDTIFIQRMPVVMPAPKPGK